MPLAAGIYAYYPGDGEQGGEPPAAVGGYPAWQAAVVRGVLFLILVLHG